MSTHSDSEECPNCGKDANTTLDTKPFKHSSIQCLNCGFYSRVVTGYNNLTAVNEEREENDLPPLKKLPKQNKDLIWE